jgi:hypothetical protein
MPWWGWLLLSFFTVLVGLILAIRCLFREFVNALFNVMDISIMDWSVLSKDKATETKGTKRRYK